MAYRIWTIDRRAALYRAGISHLLPIMRILLESAFLQLFVEVSLLGLYLANNNTQYILLEVITPLVVHFVPLFGSTCAIEADIYVISLRAGNHFYYYYHSHHTETITGYFLSRSPKPALCR